MSANDPSDSGAPAVSNESISGLDAAYSLPPGAGPFPGVIVIHELYGLNDDMRSMVQLLADHGYASVAPDLYSAGFRPLCIATTLLDTVRGGQTLSRIDEVRTWLAERPEVDGTRLGVIGYCMGGGFALAAAARYEFRVAGVNYGVAPGQASDLAGLCPVVASYGGRDRVFSRHAQRLEEHLHELGVDYDIKVYPNVGHAFLSPVRPPRWTLPARPLLHAGYGQAEAEDAWSRIFAFFDQRLAPEGGGKRA